MKQKTAKEHAFERCVCLCRKLRRNLTQDDLKSANIGGGVLFRQFGNLGKLNDELRVRYPKLFDDFVVDTAKATTKGAEKTVRAAKHLFITTAVVGCKVNKLGIQTVERMCDKLGLTFVVMICADSAARVYRNATLDQRVKNKVIVARDIRINRNLYLNAIQVQAKQLNPLVGLRRFAQDNGSFIAPSPKQFLLTAPRSQQKLPHLQITTGAITDPNYDSSYYNSQRLAKIASMDHVIGGVIVEVVNKEKFHVRHVQIDKKGLLIDRGHAWTPGSDYDIPADALILGDRHNDVIDRVAERGVDQLLDTLKPDKVFVHDLCDFRSITHHERNNLFARWKTVSANITLERELIAGVKDLEHLATKCNEVVVVKSNHDEWLDRWIDSAAFISDPANLRLAVGVLGARMNKQDTLQAGLIRVGLKSKSIRFLNRNSEVRVGKFLCSAHGDEGIAGSKPGGPAGLERAFGCGVFGHSHTVCAWRGIIQVGTSSNLKMSYNSGLTSWMHAHAAVWKTGHWQVYLIIDGMFTHR